VARIGFYCQSVFISSVIHAIAVQMSSQMWSYSSLSGRQFSLYPCSASQMVSVHDVLSALVSGIVLVNIVDPLNKQPAVGAHAPACVSVSVALTLGVVGIFLGLYRLPLRYEPLQPLGMDAQVMYAVEHLQE
jgi:hypothetical protein